MSEYDHEPTRGLPAELPEDEHIIWQSAPIGSPSPKALCISG
jgi:hypothetical protein